MPNIAVTTIFVDTVYDGLYSINLIRTHHQYLLFTGNKYHIAANHLTQLTFCQKDIREVIKVSYLLVLLVCPLIDRQIVLGSIEIEVSSIVVSKIIGVCSVADNKHLHEAEQRIGISITYIILIVNYLLHSTTRAYIKRLQFYLNKGQSINQQYDIITMRTITGVHSQLIDDFVVILAPVLDIDQCILKRRTIFTHKRINFT